ncbi:DNA polymerase III subunit epsilon [uncultured Cardiobacterium sp.]|uniref:DNA polymerase III subunit epsilon n=1 Tax=uncultured Cardiobacterium sp. TaxID=417619 RepID=UPI0026034AC8|nr:DNA polymerase III subunit epsilon [uncultured Cardiobacterium sp.]
MRQIIFDTETTGMNFNSRDKSEGHRIIEIGCIELIDRRPTENYFHQYINPEQIIDPDAVRVHGITNERVAGEPTFAAILGELLAYLDGADELIAHNMPFDQSFLNREFKLAKLKFKLEDRFRLTDTLQLAKAKVPTARHNLDVLCKYYGIDNSNRSLHGALLDSQLLAEVYLRLTTEQSGFDFAPTPAVAEKTAAPAAVQTARTAPPATGGGWQSITISDAEAAAHQAYLEKIRQ